MTWEIGATKKHYYTVDKKKMLKIINKKLKFTQGILPMWHWNILSNHKKLKQYDPDTGIDQENRLQSKTNPLISFLLLNYYDVQHNDVRKWPLGACTMHRLSPRILTTADKGQSGHLISTPRLLWPQNLCS